MKTVTKRESKSPSIGEAVGLSAKAPEFDPLTGVLDYTRLQSSTGAERIFMESLFAHLKAQNYSGEISVQEVLVIPLKKRGATQALQKQLMEIDQRYANATFSLRRPDFLSVKYGFVIEVDGSAHDSCDPRIRRDRTREAEYSLLGLQCFRIGNNQVYDADSRRNVIEDVLAFIVQEQAKANFTQAYQRRRTAISRARSKLLKAHPNIDVGTFERRPAKSLNLPNGVGTRQRGGIRYNLQREAVQNDISEAMNGKLRAVSPGKEGQTGEKRVVECEKKTSLG